MVLNKGQIGLLITIILLGMMLSITAGFALLNVREMLLSRNVKNSTIALKAANLGIEQALYIHNKLGGLTAGQTGSGTVAGVSYSWSVTEQDGSLIITSSGSTSGIKRRIRTTILGSPASMFLFWDGTSPPTGWTCVSDDPGEDFYGRFPRGSNQYAAAGVADHTTSGGYGTDQTGYHKVWIGGSSAGSWAWMQQDNWSTTGPSLGGEGYVSGTNFFVAVASHAHQNKNTTATLNAGGTQDPPFRNLKVIKYSSGIPPNIPAGAIAIFDNTSWPASGFTRYLGQDNYFIRGGSDAITTGGATSHYHSISAGVTALVTNTRNYRNGSGVTVAGASHTHTISAQNTSSANNNPLNQLVILGKADNAIEYPIGLIAMFNANPDAGYWNVISDVSGEDFYLKCLKGNAAYGNGGGSATHNHTFNIGAVSTSNNKVVNLGSYTEAPPTHTHPGVSLYQAATSYPLCRDVIIAKNLGLGSGGSSGIPTKYEEVLIEKQENSDLLANISLKFSEIFRSFLNFLKVFLA